jgi:hypothetical protein
MARATTKGFCNNSGAMLKFSWSTERPYLACGEHYEIPVRVMPLLLKGLFEIALVVGQVRITLMAKALETRIRRVQHMYSKKIA